MQVKYWLIFLLLAVLGCREAYEPPAIKASNHFLVVDGVINTMPDSKTTIQLSRTRNLADTFLTNPESGASVAIEAKSGAVYQLQEQRGSVYEADHLTLNQSDLYRLRIRTGNGSEYLSDFVEVKQTPPIDSITWKQVGDVSFYASTHDPANKARYYRWDYVETWQYRSALLSFYGLGVNKDSIYFKDVNTQTSNCWQTTTSTEILLASSVRLSEDVIDHVPIAIIQKNAEKMNIRYSMLLRQYALTAEAYNYWDILRKNTQTLGTLFDAQPGQLKSNLHNVADAAEPVIGFVSACSVQEKRIFVDHLELNGWETPPPVIICDVQTIGQDPVNPLHWTYPDTSYGPWYFVSPSGIMIAKNACLDCRRRGGTNQKPSFWQ
jgi:hypothetical protein